MLECNGAMVFIDLDETWTNVCPTCKGGSNPAECTPLMTPNTTTYSTVLVCQQVRLARAGAGAGTPTGGEMCRASGGPGGCYPPVLQLGRRCHCWSRLAPRHHRPDLTPPSTRYARRHANSTWRARPSTTRLARRIASC